MNRIQQIHSCDPKGREAIKVMTPIVTGTSAPENPVLPIGKNEAEGMGEPSRFMAPTTALGATMLIKLSAKPDAGVVTV